MERNQGEDEMNTEEMKDIADQAARFWIKKGVRSYSYDDMVQDAIEVVCKATKSWDPKRGSLRGYCFTAAKNEIYHRMTRSMAIASARGHDRTADLGATKTVWTGVNPDALGRAGSLDAPHQYPIAGSPEFLDQCAWRARVRIRVSQVVEGVEDADIGVLALMVQDGVTVAVSLGYERRRVLAAAARVRRKVSNDPTLYKMAKEMR